MRTYLANANTTAELVYKPRDWHAGPSSSSTGFKVKRWTKWTRKRARAKGTVSFHDCDPNCIDGTITRFKGTMKLSWPKTCSKGSRRYRYFSRTSLRFGPPRQSGHYDVADGGRGSCSLVG